MGRDDRGLICIPKERKLPKAVLDEIKRNQPAFRIYNVRFVNGLLSLCDIFAQVVMTSSAVATGGGTVPVDDLAWKLPGSCIDGAYGSPAQICMKLPIYREKPMPHIDRGLCPVDVLCHLFPDHPATAAAKDKQRRDQATRAIPKYVPSNPTSTVSFFSAGTINTVGSPSIDAALVAVQYSRLCLQVRSSFGVIRSCPLSASCVSQRHLGATSVLFPVNATVDNVQGTLHLAPTEVEVDIKAMARDDPLILCNPDKIRNARLPSIRIPSTDGQKVCDRAFGWHGDVLPTDTWL
jgi:hypothetical protein